MFRAAALLAFVLVTALTTSGQAAERRVALVLGNGQYVNTIKLPNPPADARAMAAKLQQLGFEVTAGYDLSVRDMQDLVSKFSRDAETASVAFVFYAGHGMQVDGVNWLIPVDANLHNTTELKFQAIKADDVLDAMPPEPAVRVLMLDACRDNPLALAMASQGHRGVVGHGLAPMSVQDQGGTGGGTIIVYSTAPDKVAYDSVGGINSPFTTALLKNLDTPDTDIQSVLTLVEGSVKAMTNNQQNPWHLASMNQIFKLKPASEPKAPASNPEVVASLTPADPATRELPATSEAWQKENALWEAASKDGTSAAYEAYLAQYPNGQFAALARAKLDAAKQAPPAAPTATAAPTEIPEAVKTTPATQGMEVDLKLSQTDRSNVQRRLTALQFPTGGTDGSFGARTRTAIRGWQKANGIVETSYLNQPQYDLLIRLSESALTKAPANVADLPATTRTVVAPPQVPRGRYARPRVVEYHYGHSRSDNGFAGSAGQFFGGMINGLGRHGW